jgi:POT family proton-dependent oligopeptide transporter
MILGAIQFYLGQGIFGDIGLSKAQKAAAAVEVAVEEPRATS